MVTIAAASSAITSSSQKPARVSAILRSSTRDRRGRPGRGKVCGESGHATSASSRRAGTGTARSRPPVSAGRSSSRTTPAAAATRPTASASASTSSAPSAPGVAVRPASASASCSADRVERADDHAGGGQQLVLGALGDDPAVADHDELVGDRLDLAQQVRGEQHGAGAVGEVAQQPAHPVDALGVQAVGRLVEDQHAAGRRAARGRCRAAGACRASSGRRASRAAGLESPTSSSSSSTREARDAEHLGGQRRAPRGRCGRSAGPRRRAARRPRRPGLARLR